MLPHKTILLLSALLFFISCGNKNQEQPGMQDEEIIPVRVTLLSATPNSDTISASGKFTTDDEVYLSFKTGGILNKLYVKEGDAIHKGQLLASLHMTEINAQVAQAEAGLEKAQREEQRAGNLYKDSVASLEQYQNSHTALELAKQQLNAARFNRQYSQIRAGGNGYVLKKMANEGQTVGPGMPILQTNGAAGGKWLLRVGVSDRDWALIQLKDKALVHISSSAIPLEGYVSRRSEAVDPYTGTFSIDILLSTLHSNAIAAGMYGAASIITTAAPTTGHDLWSVPYDALLDADGSTGYLFLTHDHKSAVKTRVSIVSMDKDKVWVKGKWQAPAYLILSGSAYLTDSSKIKVVD